MAQPQLLQIKLSRFDAQPWGFRLQGGVDFAQPLLVQKVNAGSLSEQAGMQPGDAVIKINDVDVFNLRHKDAQDIVVRSGNNFVITVQRGGSTWRPHVTPTGNMPQPNSQHLQTVTKTSLAHYQPDSQHIGCGYNNSARPFENGGSDSGVKSIVNKQYNTPVGIYSDESIAETLSAQAEVLAGGVLGVNFKKNEKEYQADRSEVLKFLREEETGQSTPEPHSPANFYWTQSHAIGGNERRTPLPQYQSQCQAQQRLQDEMIDHESQHNTESTSGRHESSELKAKDSHQDPRLIVMPICPALQGPDYTKDMEADIAVGETRPLSANRHPQCQLCGVSIVGVFVRIKDKNLHVECFKCATCGTSLKNQGYYNFNNKLYCDIHAKQAAQQHPPAGTDGYVPVPIKPNTKLSATTISSALNSHGYGSNGYNGSNGNSSSASAPVTASTATAPGTSLNSSGQATAEIMSANVSSESSANIFVEVDTKNSKNACTSASALLDKPGFEYVTLLGNVIRSVQPSGKGVGPSYQVNQSIARPYATSQPSPAAAKSPVPVSYPPQQQQQSSYATLPRSNVGQQGKNVQGYNIFNRQQPQHHKQQPQYLYQQQQQKQKYRNSYPIGSIDKYVTLPNSYNNNSYKHTFNQEMEKERLQPEFGEECCYEVNAEVVLAASQRSHGTNFSWPPPQDESHAAPTAVPLYIAPPETQHVFVSNSAQKVTPSSTPMQKQSQQAQQSVQQQSYSAPQLTNQPIRTQQMELESSSDSYTSTSTTTTTTSEEFQRMYAGQAFQMQSHHCYEQSGSELDYQLGSGSGRDVNEYSSGRRSAQECVDSLSAPLSTYKLVDMVREVSPSPIPYSEPTPAPLAARHVAFNDEPEIKELHADPETIPESVADADQTVKSQSDANIGQSTDCENLIIDRHRCQILESERIFQATPEIIFEIAPVRPRPAPSKIPNPSPKEWINPMVKVLTTAPDVPFHLVECLIPKPCDDDFVATTLACPASNLASNSDHASIDNYASKLLKEPPPLGTMFSQAMATAPRDEVQFQLSHAKDVPLPQETVPYLPPPMDMKPYLREDYRPKSPFVSALTTAPERPFEGHFDKDVPIHELDLPTPKEHLNMCDALCTAPDRGYTPLDPGNATQRLEEEIKQQHLKKNEYQVLDHEEELGITPRQPDITDPHKQQRKSSAFAAMQAFQPSCEPLSFAVNSSKAVATTQLSSISSNYADQSDIEYQKYFKAQQRNQKRLDYFHKMEEELQSPQQLTQNPTRQEHLDTNLRSLANASPATSYSYTSSTVQHSTTKNSVASSNSANTQIQSPSQGPTSIRTSFSNSTPLNAAVHSASKFDAHKIIEEIAEELEHSDVLFPPPSPLSHLKGKVVQSGLHKADTIPKYQRNWTVLPTQSPVRTPEPQELRDNVPLAFVDATKNTTIGDIVHRPIAKDSRGSQYIGKAPTAAPCVVASEVNPAVQPSVPVNIEDRSGPVTMAFQSLDAYDRADQSLTPTRPYTPSCSSVINKAAPIVPFYQTEEKLCFDECPATHARAYDQRAASPFSHRACSPAPGPPPNPLSAIRAPRIKEPQSALLSVGGPPRLLAGSITTGQSYQGQLLAHPELRSQLASQSDVKQPETLPDSIDHLQVQMREQASQHKEQSQIQSQTKTQVGNLHIERRRKITENFEHTQNAKTIEIRTGCETHDKSQSLSKKNQYESLERRQSYGRTGFVANQARRLSGLEQEISSSTVQSQVTSARVPALSESTFPQLRSPTFESKFPINISTAETTPHCAPSCLATDAYKQLGPPPGFVQQQQLQQHQKTQKEKCDISSEFSELSASQQQLRSHANATLLTPASAITSAYSSESPSRSTHANLTNASATITTTNNQACSAYKVAGASIGGSKDNKDITSALFNLPIKNGQRPNASNVASTAAEPIYTATTPASFTQNESNLNSSVDDSTGVGLKSGVFGATSAPKRGRGILNKAAGPGVRVPLCNSCNVQIRGPFITALGRIWCPDHFVCVNGNCRRPLQDIGFVEEKGDLYCEYCFEKFLAPSCSKCGGKIKGDCLNAIGKHFHPECFTCGQCGKIFGNTPFFLEDGNAYCEADWNELFTTKCFACGFPVEAGDRWVEALNHNYHSQCFNCTFCKQNLEGQSFYNKGGRPFCKNHAR